MSTKTRFIGWLVCALIVGVVSPAGWAANVWDDGYAADHAWSSGTNWDDDQVPVSGTDVTFASAGTLAQITANVTVGQLTINTPFEIESSAVGLAHNFTINGGVTCSAAGTATIGHHFSNLYLGGDQTWDIAAGSTLLAKTGEDGYGGGNFSFQDQVINLKATCSGSA